MYLCCCWYVSFLAVFLYTTASTRTNWIEHAACPHSVTAQSRMSRAAGWLAGGAWKQYKCACDASKAVRSRRRRSRSRRATWPALIFNLWRKWRRRSSEWLFNAYVPPISISRIRPSPALMANWWWNGRVQCPTVSMNWAGLAARIILPALLWMQLELEMD